MSHIHVKTTIKDRPLVFPTETPKVVPIERPVRTVVLANKDNDDGILDCHAHGISGIPDPFPTEKFLYSNENPTPEVYPDSDVVDAGRVDRGVWNPAVNYRKNEYIRYGHHKYVCIANRSNLIVPRISPNWRDTWMLLNVVESASVWIDSKGIGFDKVGSLFTLRASNYEIN